MAEALDPAIPAAVDELAKFVLREACDRRMTLAAAESCTGGLLASLLTWKATRKQRYWVMTMTVQQ